MPNNEKKNRYWDPKLVPGTLPNIFNDHIEQLWENLSPEFSSNPESKDDFLLAFKSLMINLYLSSIEGTPLVYSRSTTYYEKQYTKRGYRHWRYEIVIPLVDLMKKRGFISLKKGYYNPITEEGQKSNIVAAKVMLEVFRLTHKQQIDVLSKSTGSNKKIVLTTYKYLQHEKVVIVKGYENMDNKELREMDKFIRSYNDLISKNEILLPITSKPDMSEYEKGIFEEIGLYYIPIHSFVYRSFNFGSLRLGGRYYGANYIGLPGKIRRKLLINGEPVVECDYSSIHINLLYAKVKKQLTGDPYYYRNNEVLREAKKKMFAISLNSKNRQEALNAFGFYLNDPKEDQDKLKRIREALSEINIDGSHLLNDIISNNKAIAKFLYRGAGIHLMFKDSQIATEVISHFCLINEPILVVHDSFVVRVQMKEELSRVMKEVYKKLTGSECGVKLKIDP